MGKLYMNVILLLVICSVSQSLPPLNQLNNKQSINEINLAGKNLGEAIENKSFEYILKKMLNTTENKNTSLNLSNNNIKDFKLSVFKKLKKIYNFISINLSDNTNLQLIGDINLESVIYLDLSRTNQYEIPTVVLNLKILKFESNKIKDLSSGDFNNMNALEVIDISDNQIEFIDFDTFYNLINLKKLVLSNNPFKILPTNIIAYNNMMSELIIDNHNIQRLRKINSNSLIYLSVKNGALIKMDKDFLDGYQNLQTLLISNNSGLNELPTGLFSETLQEVDVRSCNLTRLPALTFCGTTNLTKLLISGNPLLEVQEGHFNNNCKKIELDIATRNNVTNNVQDCPTIPDYCPAAPDDIPDYCPAANNLNKIIIIIPIISASGIINFLYNLLL